MVPKCETSWPTDIVAAIRELSPGDELVWLDSATNSQSAGTSVIAIRPIAVLEQSAIGEASLLFDGGRKPVGDIWGFLEESISPGMEAPTDPSSLGPGWYGYLGFELGQELEPPRSGLKRESGANPRVIRLALFDEVIVLDHVAQRAHVIRDPSIRQSLDIPSAVPNERLSLAWETACRSKSSQAVESAEGACPSSSRSEPCRVLDRPDPGLFLAAVERAKEYIAAGDIYQVNLSQQLTVGPIDDSFTAYVALRQSNPAHFGAFLRWKGAAIASVSPELFLELRGRHVRTCPIKGTRPRVLNPMLDQSAMQNLLASQKDAAELAMIVDLHRNDLGRVCEWGSVQVKTQRRIETHPTVFHTAAEIDGTLRRDCSAIDLIKACFPAGSITGVPKVRAMEIIRELEPHSRGVYCGAIGCLTRTGNLSLSVAIRTLQIVGAKGILHGGGGIVAESDAKAEYLETLSKIRGILQGLGIEIHAEASA